MCVVAHRIGKAWLPEWAQGQACCRLMVYSMTGSSLRNGGALRGVERGMLHQTASNHTLLTFPRIGMLRVAVQDRDKQHFNNEAATGVDERWKQQQQ